MSDEIEKVARASEADGEAVAGALASPSMAAPTRAAGDRGPAPGSVRGGWARWGTAAVLGLVAGAGLLVFTDASWTHALGVAGLLLCAVAVFSLTAAPLDR